MRKIVLTHPDYKQDSVVTDEISYDLVRAAACLGNNCVWDKELLGEPWWKQNQYIEHPCKSLQERAPQDVCDNFAQYLVEDEVTDDYY